MALKCSVCRNKKRKSNMQYIKAIDDWLCKDCLRKGKEKNISNLEEGRKLTAQIRGEELDGEDN